MKAMSQHVIWNAWYPVRFAHPGGIHQSCPIEILHWILLGMYKYSRLSLFEQTGKTSILSTNLNALAINMGFLFQRQSDRERPRTSFSKGVKQGKLMGHDDGHDVGSGCVVEVKQRSISCSRYSLRKAERFLCERRFSQ